MEELCEDVLMDMLSRLGVKDLVRVKSVCKRWRATISSQALIDLHHRKSCLTAIRVGLIHYTRYKPGWFCVARFVGSCDGLVCLCHQGNDLIRMWNPALNNACTLFVKTIPPDDDLELCSWFGRESGGGYVLIVGTTSHLHVIILCTSGEAKKKKQELKKSYKFFHEEIGTLFQNVVYWAAETCIVWYDLGKETIGEVVAPPQSGYPATHLSLGEVDGCLVGGGSRGYILPIVGDERSGLLKQARRFHSWCWASHSHPGRTLYR